MAKVFTTLLVSLVFAATAQAKEARTVRLIGRVKEPGERVMQDNFGLINLLFISGGILSGGCPKDIHIVKTKDEGKKVTRIDAYKTVMEDLPDVPLEQGVNVFVMEHTFPCVSQEELKLFNQQLVVYVENRKRKED